MNVVVPLGGLGNRFQVEGYARPKPFVRVLGKEMILWVLDNLSLGPQDTLVIVFNPAFMAMDVFMREIVQARFANCTLVELCAAAPPPPPPPRSPLTPRSLAGAGRGRRAARRRLCCSGCRG